MTILDTIRQGLAQFTGELKKLRGEIEALQQARENLLSQPAAKADVTAVMHAWVDAQRALFLKSLAQRLQSDIVKPGLDLTDPERIGRHVASGFYGVVGSNGANSSKAVDTTLAGLFGGLLKSALATALDEMPWPGEPGLPMTERNKRVASIDKQLDQLQSKERELVEAAQLARITVD